MCVFLFVGCTKAGHIPPLGVTLSTSFFGDKGSSYVILHRFEEGEKEQLSRGDVYLPFAL